MRELGSGGVELQFLQILMKWGSVAGGFPGVAWPSVALYEPQPKKGKQTKTNKNPVDCKYASLHQGSRAEGQGSKEALEPL